MQTSDFKRDQQPSTPRERRTLVLFTAAILAVYASVPLMLWYWGELELFLGKGRTNWPVVAAYVAFNVVGLMILYQAFRGRRTRLTHFVLTRMRNNRPG